MIFSDNSDINYLVMRRFAPTFLVIAFLAAVISYSGLMTDWESASKTILYVFSALFLISLVIDRPPKNMF